MQNPIRYTSNNLLKFVLLPAAAVSFYYLQSNLSQKDANPFHPDNEHQKADAKIEALPSVAGQCNNFYSQVQSYPASSYNPKRTKEGTVLFAVDKAFLQDPSYAEHYKFAIDRMTALTGGAVRLATDDEIKNHKGDINLITFASVGAGDYLCNQNYQYMDQYFGFLDKLPYGPQEDYDKQYFAFRNVFSRLGVSPQEIDMSSPYKNGIKHYSQKDSQGNPINILASSGVFTSKNAIEPVYAYVAAKASCDTGKIMYKLDMEGKNPEDLDACNDLLLLRDRMGWHVIDSYNKAFKDADNFFAEADKKGEGDKYVKQKAQLQAAKTFVDKHKGYMWHDLTIADVLKIKSTFGTPEVVAQAKKETLEMGSFAHMTYNENAIQSLGVKCIDFENLESDESSKVIESGKDDKTATTILNKQGISGINRGL